MLRLFRDHLAKYFIIAALLAFMATIFFSWGMGTSQSNGSTKNNVGVINGKELDYSKFNSFYSRTINNISKNKEITEQERRQVLSNVWQQFISEFVFKDFEEVNNLSVTGAELFAFLKKNPPQDFLNNPQFLVDGVFDTTKYVNEFLNNPEMMKQNEQYIRYIEEQYSNYLLKDKISKIIAGSIYPSVYDKEGYIKANSELGKFQYIKVPFSKFTTEKVEVSDNDIKAYFNKNYDTEDKFENVNLSVLKLKKTPSKKDTLYVIKDLKAIRDQHKENSDFPELASYYSEKPGADSTKGNLGFLSKSKVPYALKSVIDSMKIGDLSENVLFGDGYYIYKLEDKKGAADSSEFKLSEIYLPIKVTPDTEDSLRDVLEASKLTFKVEGVKVDTTGLFSLGSTIPGVGVMSNVSAFAYRGVVGDISEVLETNDAMFMFKLIDKKDKGTKDYTAFKDEIISALKKDTMELKAKTYAQTLLPKLATLSMDSVANSDGYVLYYSNPEAKKMSDYIQGAGVNSEFHTAAFLLKDHETTKNVVTTRDGAFIIKRIFTHSIDSTQIKMLEKQYEIGFKKNSAQFMNLWFQSIQDNVEIEDYRYRFF